MEEHSCLLLTPLHVTKLRYDAQAQEYTLLHSAELFRRDKNYILYL